MALLLLLFLPTIFSAPSTPQTQSNEDEAFISAIISLLSRATVVAELRANDSSMPFEMSITRFIALGEDQLVQGSALYVMKTMLEQEGFGSFYKTRAPSTPTTSTPAYHNQLVRFIILSISYRRKILTTDSEELFHSNRIYTLFHPQLLEKFENFRGISFCFLQLTVKVVNTIMVMHLYTCKRLFMTMLPSSLFSCIMFISVVLLSLRNCESSVVQKLYGCGLRHKTPISPITSPATALPRT